jgi:hypothetical protein
VEDFAVIRTLTIFIALFSSLAGASNSGPATANTSCLKSLAHFHKVVSADDIPLIMKRHILLKEGAFSIGSYNYGDTEPRAPTFPLFGQMFFLKNTLKSKTHEYNLALPDEAKIYALEQNAKPNLVRQWFMEAGVGYIEVVPQDVLKTRRIFLNPYTQNVIGEKLLRLEKAFGVIVEVGDYPSTHFYRDRGIFQINAEDIDVLEEFVALLDAFLARLEGTADGIR